MGAERLFHSVQDKEIFLFAAAEWPELRRALLTFADAVHNHIFVINVFFVSNSSVLPL